MEVKTKEIIKCACGANKKTSCSNCSKIKMVVMLKNGYEHLKLRHANGGLINPVYYNFMSKNRKPQQKIIDGMKHRFFNPETIKIQELKKATNKIMFFDNDTKEHLQSYDV